MFLIIGVEDVEGIAVRNLDDLAGEGIGEGRGAVSSRTTNPATMIRPMLALCELILALFFRVVRTQLDRKTER